ncbi:zinc C3HC4 type RING finger protein, putative [Babesia ovis]|uniref:Zinc C3HC4 type RING finger protein, putative n=1 Tax=Babesia ovis TaxID=5869 RepID=A0A9W5WUH6_BABOV|nr:zinc C3HC4 type RING finger protein, putative [Babesia ovis]
MTHSLQWKLKGTNVPYTTSRLVTLPCSVKDAQQKLKEECGLQHVSAIEYVLYLASNDSEVLPGGYQLEPPCKVLVSRCKSSEAQKLMEEAEKTKSLDAAQTSKATLTSTQLVNSTLPVKTTQSSVSAQPVTSTSQRKSIPNVKLSSSVDDASTAVSHEPTAPASEDNTSENDDANIYNHLYDDFYEGSEGHSANVNSANEANTADTEHHADDTVSGNQDVYSVDDPSTMASDDQTLLSMPVEETEVLDSDEDSRIQAVMQQRDYYGGDNQDTLSRRYYRNRATTAADADRGSTKAQRTPVPIKIHPDTTQDAVPVDNNYICHMCGQRGHHIKNCTQPEGKRIHKKIRPATGIPVDFLQVINEDDINNYDEVYHLKTGQFAVMKDMSKVSGGAFFTKSADQRIQSQLGLTESSSKSMVRGLRCSVCNNFFNNPVTTMCCGESFCLDCVVGTRASANLSHVYSCPRCRADLRFSDLQTNTSLKNTIEALVLRKDEILNHVGSSQSLKRDGPSHCTIEVDPMFLKRQKTLSMSYLSRIRPGIKH